MRTPQNDRADAQMLEEYESAINSFDLGKIMDVSREILFQGRLNSESESKQWVVIFLRDLNSLGISGKDLGERAYFKTRKLVLPEDRGPKDSEDGSLKKSSALHWYRQSLKYGDLPFANRYLKKYLRFQVTNSGELVGSLRLAHPLSGIPKIKRFQFKESLTPSQRSVVDRAVEWYRQTYLRKNRRQAE